MKYDFWDTLFSMLIGWAINTAMILLATTTFFKEGIVVNDLQQVKSLLDPLLGNNAGVVFALALLFAEISSTMTSGIAAGSIFAGMYDEPYNKNDIHSRLGVVISLGVALLIIFVINNPFKGLIISQAILSLQLPITVFVQVKLTSSEKAMGKFANSSFTKCVLYMIAGIVTFLNILLLISFFTD